MIDYEILLMLDADLADERQSEIVTRTRELIERGGGLWERHEVWGRRKLAYEINHKGEGNYHLLTFRAAPETLEEVSRVLKITEVVMRHMPVRRPGTRPTQPIAAAARASDDGESTTVPSFGEEE